MAKGRKVWIEYGMIKVDESWWKWDEEEKVLIDGRGMIEKRTRGMQGSVEGGNKKVEKVREKRYRIDGKIRIKEKREGGGYSFLERGEAE